VSRREAYAMGKMLSHNQKQTNRDQRQG